MSKHYSCDLETGYLNMQGRPVAHQAGPDDEDPQPAPEPGPDTDTEEGEDVGV